METFGLFFAIITSVAFWVVAGVTAMRIFRPEKAKLTRKHGVSGKASPPPASSSADFTRKDALWVAAFGIGVRVLTLLLAAFILSGEYENVAVFRSFLRGDAPHYINLAGTGYSWQEDGRNILLVFFPLYPYLVRGVNFIFRDYIFSAFFVSFAAYLAGLVFVFRLVLLDFSKRVAWWAVGLISIAPPGFFFGAPMTESLMLLTSAATLYYIRKHKWLATGVVGALTVFTRMVGIVLFAAAAAEIIQSGAWKKGQEGREKTLWILLMTAGGAAYLLLNWYISGNPFQFMYYQRTHWHNTTQYFGITVYNQFQNIAGFGNQAVVNATFIPNVLAFLFAVLLIVYACFKKFNAAYIVYALGYTFVSFSPTWLLSGARYMVACVPLFIFLARAADEKPVLSGIVIALFLTGLYLMMGVFISGGPVF